MRRLIPALLLAAALVAHGAPAHAGNAQVASVTSEVERTLAQCGVALPRVELPNVCGIKAGLSKLSVDLHLAVQASVSLAARLGADLSTGVNALVGQLSGAVNLLHGLVTGLPKFAVALVLETLCL